MITLLYVAYLLVGLLILRFSEWVCCKRASIWGLGGGMLLLWPLTIIILLTSAIQCLREAHIENPPLRADRS